MLNNSAPKRTRYRRAVRLLVALSANPEGLVLGAVMAELGEAGRNASCANVTMLKALRGRNHVDYLPQHGIAKNGGWRCGTYVITPEGAQWLAGKLAELDGEEIFEVDSPSKVATGAMAGDRPIVVLSKACTGQAPVGCIASVFHLGLRAQDACTLAAGL